MSPRTKRSKSSLSCANRKRLLTRTPSPGNVGSSSTEACSVMLTDIFKDAIERIANLERELQILRDVVTRCEPAVSDLSAVRYLINPPPQPDLKLATVAGKLINNVASEISRRLHSAKNAVVFNVPDDCKLSIVHTKLLNACNLNPGDCECIRLRKKHQKYQCPLLFKFKSETHSEYFIKSQNYLRQFTQFKNIRIIKDRTPLERALYIKPTALTPSNVVNAGLKTGGYKSPQVDGRTNTTPSPTQIPTGTRFVGSPLADMKTSGSTQRPQITSPRSPVDLDLTSVDLLQRAITVTNTKPASPLQTPRLLINTAKTVNARSPQSNLKLSTDSPQTIKTHGYRRHSVMLHTNTPKLTRQRSVPIPYRQAPSPQPVLRATLVDRAPQGAVQNIQPSLEIAPPQNLFRGPFPIMAPAMLTGPTSCTDQTHLISRTIPYPPPVALISPPPSTQLGLSPPRLPNLMDFFPPHHPYYYPASNLTQPPPSIT